MPVNFKLPEELITYDYDKILIESEIKRGTFYEKPKSLLDLIKTMPDLSKKNVPVFTTGNLSAIQGKAKSRKTFFIILLASMIKMRNDLRFAIFDTEQYNWHSALMLHRIDTLAPDNSIRLFNLRKYSIDVRLEFVEDFILKNKPQLIFLDNIRDCMIDINSWGETNKILTTFIQLADSVGTHICLTLHENPGTDNDKARGAIGTELQNKCETIFRLEKDKNDPRYTTAKGLFTRNMDFDSLTFEIDENGLPILKSDFEAIKQNDIL